ncbi:MAG: hypothetical protein J5855_11240 [Mailhella sp.]|nr:hypothetical protein [Mailhella sp.]
MKPHLIILFFAQPGDNIEETSRILGMHPQTLYRKWRIIKKRRPSLI